MGGGEKARTERGFGGVGVVSPGNKPTNRILWNTPSLPNLRPWD